MEQCFLRQKGTKVKTTKWLTLRISCCYRGQLNEKGFSFYKIWQLNKQKKEGGKIKTFLYSISMTIQLKTIFADMMLTLSHKKHGISSLWPEICSLRPEILSRLSEDCSPHWKIVPYLFVWWLSSFSSSFFHKILLQTVVNRRSNS